MSRASRIIAFLLTLAVVFGVVAFMLWRIGGVIGWDSASRDWPVIVLLVALILIVAFFMYVTVRGKLNR
jgi:hypothetical protein